MSAQQRAEIKEFAHALLEAAHGRVPANSDWAATQSVTELTITVDQMPGAMRTVYTYDPEDDELTERYEGPRSMAETCRVFDQLEGMRCPDAPVMAGLCAEHVTELLESIAHEIRRSSRRADRFIPAGTDRGPIGSLGSEPMPCGKPRNDTAIGSLSIAHRFTPE